MKAEPIRLIPRKLTINLELSFVNWLLYPVHGQTTLMIIG